MPISKVQLQVGIKPSCAARIKNGDENKLKCPAQSAFSKTSERKKKKPYKSIPLPQQIFQLFPAGICPSFPGLGFSGDRAVGFLPSSQRK